MKDSSGATAQTTQDRVETNSRVRSANGVDLPRRRPSTWVLSRPTTVATANQSPAVRQLVVVDSASAQLAMIQ